MITIDPPSTPHTEHLAPSKPTLTRFLSRARTAVGLAGEVDVLLTTDAQLKSLNRSYRGKNKPTDVLSFPTPPEIAEQHAGDLAISLDTAARQAATYNHSLDTEVRILLLHGLLHLAGEDHEVDSGEMAAREATLRAQLKLPGSLIDRVTSPSKRAPALKPSSRPKAAHPARTAVKASGKRGLR
jgi:probable rRNA maturation factor